MVKHNKIHKNEHNNNNNIISGGKVISENTTIFTPLLNLISFMNKHVMYLNNSKFFAGIIMILLNVGSKFVTIQFSKSTEEYMKYTLSKQILVFAMSWMGTRDIYIALGLTAVFTILSDHLFNEESHLCVVPHDYRVLHKLIDTNDNNNISDAEISSAISVLEKAKQEKQRKQQKEALRNFDFEKYNFDK
uniref:EF-hand domain-containing protein n=1 Tax=viral metagenome TaxID=1070528 RepID=A0A6C0DIA7_9ZZZZ